MYLVAAAAHRIYVDTVCRPRLGALVASSAGGAQTLALVVHGMAADGMGSMPRQLVWDLALEAIRGAQPVAPEVSLEALLRRIDALFLSGECPSAFYKKYWGGAMGAVLAAAWFGGERVAIAHVGDCRVLRQRGDAAPEALTEDHTLINLYRRHGEPLSEEQERKARTAGHNVVVRAFGVTLRDGVLVPWGVREELPWELRVEQVAVGDTFLVSSGCVEPPAGELLAPSGIEDAPGLQEAVERVLSSAPGGRSCTEGTAILVRCVAHPIASPPEAQVCIEGVVFPER